MSDKEEEAPEKPFYVDRAKTGRASCKKCKQKISQGDLRFAKLGQNPFGSGTMKMWHHIPCIFEVFKKQRATTKKIEGPNDIGGWYDISEDDQNEIKEYFSPELKEIFDKCKTNENPKTKREGVKESNKTSDQKESKNHKDMSFRAFRKLCADIAEASSYNAKTTIVKEFLKNGSNKTGFTGDVILWCRMLLPGVVKRNYNLQSKQLVKIFSKIFETKQEDMLEDLEKGDVAETISKFFEESKCYHPLNKSTLTLTEVDEFLRDLSSMTKEDEQAQHFTKIVKKCTTNDLKMLVRLIKHDLRINAGAKHILEALHPDAYKAFQTSRDIKAVVRDAMKANSRNNVHEMKESSKKMCINLRVMTPILPMLAQVCKSADIAIKKFPDGMYSEIKYDGERVQVHKKGSDFRYFSRSLRPVLSHKVKHFKEYIPMAFPHATDLILDAEILMVDKYGKPLPFGTLGIHKQNSFRDANVCLFVFDCIYYNGESLILKPIKERKEVLTNVMVEVKNHVMFSDLEEIHAVEDLEEMMTKVFRLGLEGLVLKDLRSPYEPGKRHWLKIKKDYLNDGAMADSADLLVLGAWFGTGTKGGMMSIFLMGCYDESTKTWRTVTKVHSGHDDATLAELQNKLEMMKISKDPRKVPNWLKCARTMVPDFIAKNPENMPVWEITGAEFTRNQVHTADGISIRFPRVTKIRTDKDWTTATSLSELRSLYKTSKDTTGFTLRNSTAAATTLSQPKDPQDDSYDLSEDTAGLILSSANAENADDGNEESTSSSSGNKSNDNDSRPISCSPPSKRSKLDPDPDDTETEDENDEKPDRSLFDKAGLNPLPDIFDDCVLQIPLKYKHYNFLRRYLIAYGAVLYEGNRNDSLEDEELKVTHVIHVKRKSALTKQDFWADDVRHVHVSWIWDSIKMLRRQKEKNYFVSCK